MPQVRHEAASLPGHRCDRQRLHDDELRLAEDWSQGAEYGSPLPWLRRQCRHQPDRRPRTGQTRPRLPAHADLAP